MLSQVAHFQNENGRYLFLKFYEKKLNLGCDNDSRWELPYTDVVRVYSIKICVHTFDHERFGTHRKTK